jgi:hypothetical protein
LIFLQSFKNGHFQFLIIMELSSSECRLSGPSNTVDGPAVPCEVVATALMPAMCCVGLCCVEGLHLTGRSFVWATETISGSYIPQKWGIGGGCLWVVVIARAQFVPHWNFQTCANVRQMHHCVGRLC